ncbi:MAG: site-specific integrase [Deinococcota bacterium]|jgi:integrase/recombinase XerD|nr:site-specific integrase [Deinococcota bacterium]
MAKSEKEMRGQIPEAKFVSSLSEVIRETTRLWRRNHLSYDQSRYVIEQVRRELELSRPKERRRTVARLDRFEVERLIEAAYRKGSRYGLMVKTLFYTGARVSEFVNIKAPDLYLDLEPPQVYLAVAKGGSDGYVPILPTLAQELRTYLSGRKTVYLFESNRRSRYTSRAVQLIVQDAAKRAGIEKAVTPHRLRASVATLLLDAGMPIDQVQKFLRHKNVTTTQIYAETSLHNLGENYLRALS